MLMEEALDRSNSKHQHKSNSISWRKYQNTNRNEIIKKIMKKAPIKGIDAVAWEPIMWNSKQR